MTTNSLLLTLVISHLLFTFTQSTDTVTLRTYALDRVRVVPNEINNGDMFSNFAILYPSDDVKDHMVGNGIGTFLNVSYSTLFTRLSIDQSFLFIVSDQCDNCVNNILFNMSHSLTGEIYGFESSDCWSNLFVISSASYAQCEVQMQYSNQTLSGVLGYDNMYFTEYSKSFTMDNMVFILEQDGELIDRDINGIFGMGQSDAEGSYGFSVFELLMNNDMMETPVFSVCVDPIGNGQIYLSAYSNGTHEFDDSLVTWYEQTTSHQYSIYGDEINFYGWNVELPNKQIHLTFNTPYLKLPQNLLNGYKDAIKSAVCEQKSLGQLCMDIEDMVNGDSFSLMKLQDLNLLNELPVLQIRTNGLERKTTFIEIKKLIAICPEDVKEYVYAEPDTDVKICSMVRLNMGTEADKVVLGNIAHTSHGNLYIFNKRLGHLGMVKDVYCYENPHEENIIAIRFPQTYSFMAQVAIIISFFLLLIFSLNKCDEYFYEEDENEGEENLMNFLSQGRSETDQQNQTQNRQDESRMTGMQ